MRDRQGSKMRRLLFGTILGTIPLALVLLFPLPSTAEVFVDVNISLPLPPHIEFVEPPELIVLPETYIYVVPDVDMEIFFYGGWWWQLWENRWYRSRDYDSGWTYYRNTPSFYRQVPSYWRTNYRENRWSGHEWNYQRIPEQHVRQNWRNWEKKRYWEHQQTWGVEDLQPQTQSRQHVRQMQQRQSRPQVQEIKSRPPQQQRKQPELRPQTQSRQPFRQVQPRQSRPHVQEMKSRPPQQHREAGPQSRKGGKQQNVQQQGKHKGGKEEKQGKR